MVLSNIARYVWLKIDEPRVHRFLIGIRYILGAALGILIVATPPVFINHTWIASLLPVSGWFIIVGSTLGACFAWTRRWLWERPGTILVITGVTVGLLLEIATVTVGVSAQPQVNIELAVLFAMHLLSMLARLVEISNDDYEITREEIEREADKILPRHTNH